MHRFERRINKLRDTAYTFVPDPEYTEIAKQLREQLDAAEKRPGLQARLMHLDDLFESWRSTKDPVLQEQLRRIFLEDREVMLRFMLLAWVDRATAVPGGAWVEKGLGTRTLSITREMKVAEQKKAAASELILHSF
jgi:hypothetical protein